MDASVDVDVGAVDLGDMRGVGRWIPEGVGISSVEGSATGSAHASFVFPAQTVGGGAAIQTPRIAVHARKALIASALEASIELERGAWGEGDWTLGPSTVALHNVTVRTQAEPMGVIASVDVSTSQLVIRRKETTGTLK